MKVNIICDYCGKIFERHDYDVVRTKNHFCKLKHAYAFRIGRKTQPCSEEKKKKISESNTGKTRTEEEKQERSKNMMGSKNHFYGCKHTDKSKKQMSVNSTGQKDSDEQRENKRTASKKFHSSFRGRLRSFLIKLI